jgi:hypothetical protein
VHEDFEPTWAERFDTGDEGDGHGEAALGGSVVGGRYMARDPSERRRVRALNNVPRCEIAEYPDRSHPRCTYHASSSRSW